MKRVILCPNPYRDGELTVAKHSKEILEAIGFETVVCLPFSREGYDDQLGVPIRQLQQEIKRADMLIAFGGDGTILHLARTVALHSVPVLGINLGSLGFMSELEPNELERLTRAQGALHDRLNEAAQQAETAQRELQKAEYELQVAKEQQRKAEDDVLTLQGKQDHYVCNNYKSNRGTCTAHYIREDVLREIVLERIRAVNEYIRSDVDGFQEEWLQCRRTDQERSIRDDKKKLEQAKKRLADLDVIIARLYEDYVLGNLNQDRYRKMSADYEAEQERLKLEIEVIEEWVEQREEMNDGLHAFIALTQKYVDVEELTQTIVNEYIKKIVVYAPDKSSGKRKQKVKIFFNFVDDVDIPVISEPIITQTTYEHRKTA